jgi:hypothetical protein
MSTHTRTGSLRKVIGRLALTALYAAGVYQVVMPTDAFALTRRTVCAQDLYVRDGPAGIVIGTLFYGETFDVDRYSPSGQWVYGYAWGHANKWGWVQNGWFC